MSLFAEMFNEMLVRDFGFKIHKALNSLPEKEEEEKDKKKKDKKDDRKDDDKDKKDEKVSVIVCHHIIISSFHNKK